MKLNSIPLPLILLTLMLLLAGCSGGSQTSDSPNPYPTYTPYPTNTPYPTSTPSAALSFDNLSVPLLTISSASSSVPSYDRDDWHHWIDSDGDCQNTRHEVLLEESITPVTFTDARECSVLKGQWLAPFSGVHVFAASELDVDHTVPLANAHKSGGWAWGYDKRMEYANNLSFEGHLIAVTASANRSKGARGPEDWQPADKNYWCRYAIDWITVKYTWSLTATPQEWSALVDMLGNCAYEVTITGKAVVAYQTPGVISYTSTLTAMYAWDYDPLGQDRDCGDFANWQEAQAFFGAAGGPNKDRHGLDRDKDGIACASLPGSP